MERENPVLDFPKGLQCEKSSSTETSLMVCLNQSISGATLKLGLFFQSIPLKAGDQHASMFSYEKARAWVIYYAV